MASSGAFLTLTTEKYALRQFLRPQCFLLYYRPNTRLHPQLATLPCLTILVPISLVLLVLLEVESIMRERESMALGKDLTSLVLVKQAKESSSRCQCCPGI